MKDFGEFFGINEILLSKMPLIYIGFHTSKLTACCCNNGFKKKEDKLPKEYSDKKLQDRVEKLSKLIHEHKSTEELLQNRTDELHERVKELDCLYAISNLFESPELSLDEILFRTVEFIPPAWQYPDNTCARIILKHRVFQTHDFNETRWKQSCDIVVNEESVGLVEVYYLKKRPDMDEGPFLKGEARLINAIAEKLGKIIWIKSAEKALRENEERYRILSEKVADGVILVQDAKLLYANRAFVSLFNFEDSLRIVNKKIDELFQLVNFDGESFYGSFEAAEPGDEFFRKVHFQTKGQEKWIEGHHTIIQFKEKPAVLSAIRDITEKVLQDKADHEETERLKLENISLRSSMKERYKFGSIIGKSQPMQEVYDLILKATNTPASVCIYGESGTGKELVAQAIHEMGNRRNKELVTVHCGAIPDLLLESEFFGHKKGAFTGAYVDKMGYLDLADGGSLFLDEVGELGLNMQVKLLRTIDGKDYTPVGSNKSKVSDFRIIAASNRNLKDEVRKGQMREDFFYRINVILINLPPLRDRKEDILLLIDHFLNVFKEGEKPIHLPGKVIDALLDYNWPGNIRELKNIIHRYITVGKIDFSDSSHASQSGQEAGKPESALPSAVEKLEKTMISNALSQTNWNRSRAAAILGISRKALFRKMEKYKPE